MCKCVRISTCLCMCVCTCICGVCVSACTCAPACMREGEREGGREGGEKGRDRDTERAELIFFLAMLFFLGFDSVSKSAKQTKTGKRWVQVITHQ